jgi:glycosyltransferase involved in cell wall biosynthesis
LKVAGNDFFPSRSPLQNPRPRMKGVPRNQPLAFFIQDLREGGAERNVARVLNGIVARDIPTDLVVIRRTGSFFEELDPRVNVVQLPQARTITSILGLKRYLETRRPLALVSSLTHTNVAAIMANMLARHRTRLIVVERNQFSTNRELKKGLVRLSYGLVPMVYRKADCIAAVSMGVRDDLAATTRLPAGEVEVLYNPVVSEVLFERADEPVTHPWLVDRKVPVVIGLGRFSPQKNFPLLIAAIAEARRERPLRLIILGEGALRPELEAQIRDLGLEDDVDLPGFDPNPFRFLKHASLYVLSSDWEGLPTALIEAMACGTPVVATDCDSGPGEILDDGRLGRIVPRGDVKAMAGAILATLDSPGDAAERVARAREFSLDRAVDRYLEVAGWA